MPISDKILGFYAGPIPGQITLITATNIIYVSDDGGATFIKRKVQPNHHLELIELLHSIVRMWKDLFGLVKNVNQMVDVHLMLISLMMLVPRSIN